MEPGLEVRRFLDGEGRVTQLPVRLQKKLAVLDYLAEKFEKDRFYTEREVNAICRQWHTFDDHYLLRRELVDHGRLCREPDGSRYWRCKEAEPVGRVT